MYTHIHPMDHTAYTKYIPCTYTWDVRGIVCGMYVGCTRDCTKLNCVHHVHPRTSADMSAGFLLLAYPPLKIGQDHAECVQNMLIFKKDTFTIFKIII